MIGLVWKALPGRRREVGLITGLIGGLVVLIWRIGTGGAGIALLGLEVLLPLGPAIVAAGLLAEDPLLDLLLSVPQPARRTLGHRLAVVLGWGAGLSLSLQAGAAWAGIALPRAGPTQTLIWVTPLILYTGLATAGALIRGRMLDGVTLALAVWTGSLLTLPLLRVACAEAPASGCLLALASPAMTQLLPTDPLWLLNRGLWLGVGSLLLSLGWVLTQQEERLLAAVGSE